MPASDDLTFRLRAAGCVFAEQEAAVLREAAGSDVERLAAMTARRVAGEPLEQVVGFADLGGVRVHLSPDVFVPRQRSLLLAERAVELAGPAGAGATVVDLCCGSGALGAVVAARRPDLRVHAADVDPASTACARRNLPGHRVHTGDLFDALPHTLLGRVDVLLVNAPYVPTDAIALMPPEARDHEPTLALDGGADGLDVHRRVLAGAGAWLAVDGVLLLETSEDQAPVDLALAATAGLSAVVVADPDRGATMLECRTSGH